MASERNLKRVLVTSTKLTDSGSAVSRRGTFIKTIDVQDVAKIDKKSMSFKTTLSKLQTESSDIYENLTTLSRTRRDPISNQRSLTRTENRRVVPLKSRPTLLGNANNSMQPSLMLDNSKQMNDKRTLSNTRSAQKPIVTPIQFHTNRVKPRGLGAISPLISPTNLTSDLKIIITEEKDKTSQSYEAQNGTTVRKRDVSLLSKKRFLTAQRIIKGFDNSISNFINPKQRKVSDDDDDLSDALLSIRSNIELMIDSIDDSINARKEKPVFEEYLERMVDCAQKTKNLDLHLAALRTQGKVRLIYNDIYRAIVTFKLIKYLADQNRSFTFKLKAYKYLGICFHRVRNYRMATFYHIKMLQTAWLCQSNRYELLAYDKIGVEYYYQGDLSKANFYHERMMSGTVEPKDSKLRQLGITKLLNRMAEGANPARKRRTKKVEEELNDYEIPASEDEFELPSPRNQRHVDRDGGSLERSETSSPKRRTNTMRNRTFFVLKKMFNETSRHGDEKRNVKSRGNLTSNLNSEASSLAMNRNKKDLFEGPLNHHVLLSHMSPNRLLNNFHPKDTKYIVSTYIARGTDSDENFAILDLRSLEEIRRKLEKLKDNIKLALSTVLEKYEATKQIARPFYDEQNIK